MSERTTSTCAVIGKHQADGADCCEGPQEKAPRLGGAWRKACFTASLVTVVVVMLVMLASCRNRKGGLARLMLPPHREQETRDEPAPAAATSAAAAGLGQEEAGGDTQTATGATAVGPSIGEPVAELDSPRGEEDSEALGVVVMLTDPQQMANAVFLKSEKIVYCPIQKVASAEWNRVLRWVDGDPEAMVGDPWKKGTLNRLKDTNIERVNDMLNSPEWLKFAVVREPAHRLLSCFLQKCATWNMRNEYENCPYLKLWPSLFDNEQRKHDDKTFTVITKAFKEHGRRSMFSSYVAEIARRVKRAPCAQNGHWAPQYCHCSLDITAPAFQIVGFRNMSEAGASLIVPAVSSPQRRAEVSEFLKSRMGADHDTGSKQTGSDALFDKFYTDDMLAQVRDAFAKDYTLFSQFWE